MPLKPCLINYPKMKTKPDTIAQMSQYLGLKNLAVHHTELIQRAHEKQLGLLDFLDMVLGEEALRKRDQMLRVLIIVAVEFAGVAAHHEFARRAPHKRDPGEGGFVA